MYRQGVMAATGDYYRGDGLFSFIGKGLKFVGGLLPGVGGLAANAVGGLLDPQKKAVAVQRATVMSQNPIGGTNLPPPPTFSGVSIGGPYGLQVGTSRAPVAGSSRAAAVALGGKKKSRRMNVTNVKALRRAGRRVIGFEKLAKRFIGFASPRKPKGRVYFRARARKRA